MCFTNCCLIFFTIRAGSVCVSSVILALGLIGAVAIPFLPYSNNVVQFGLIMAYMNLLIIAFSITLYGSLMDSKFSVGLGLFLGLLAFIFWFALTIPSLIVFNKSYDSNYCLGPNCGESHWLVPRSWGDQKNQRSDVNNIFKKRDMLVSRSRPKTWNRTTEHLPAQGTTPPLPVSNQTENEDEFSENIAENVTRETKADNQNQKIPTTTQITENQMRDELIDDLLGYSGIEEQSYDDVMDQNEDEEEIEQVIKQKGNDFAKSDRKRSTHDKYPTHINNATFNIKNKHRATLNQKSILYKSYNDPPTFRSNENGATYPLTKFGSQIMAALYALLFCCVLTTICMNLSHLSRRGKDCCQSTCSTQHCSSNDFCQTSMCSTKSRLNFSPNRKSMHYNTGRACC